MQLALPTPRRKARIEIIPLIDIIFFLLATFVLVSMSMVKNQGVSVRLPVAQTSAPLPRNETMIIRVAEDGSVYINKQLYPIEAISEPLQAFQKENTDPRVVIQGDAEASYGQVITVLDSVRQAGISKVAVQTDKKGHGGGHGGHGRHHGGRNH